MIPESLVPYVALVPEIGLLILTAIVLVYGRQRRREAGIFTGWGLAALLVVTFGLWFAGQPAAQPQSLWGGMFRHDEITLIFRLMFLLAALLTTLISVDVKRLQHGEYYALIMLATVGFNMMAASADLMLLYLALETASISFYCLAGFATEERRSPEAGIKYFVYGAVASGVMLYGLSLLYGLSGANSTNIYDLAAAVNRESLSLNPVLLLASFMVLAGFGFKISAVPFHFWAPDVYEGAPSSVTAILSTASKAAGFAILLRVFTSGVFGFPVPDKFNWWIFVWFMCGMTMVLGNAAAISQTNIKRMLAYSSVAQAGYVLMGLLTFTADGAGAAMFYLFMYVATNIAAFGVVVLVSNVTKSDEMTDLYGLSRRSPWLAIVMLLALLSLGGIPPTAGFFAKFFLFQAAVEQGYWGLALFAIINAFVALYYYLNVAKYLYLYRSPDEDKPIPVTRVAQVGLALSSLLIVYLGVAPETVYAWSVRAAQAFFLPG